MTQRILVTGAGGFIGSAMAAALSNAGNTVVATDLHFDAATRDRLTTAQLVAGPLPDVLANLTDSDVDCVIHAAAITADPARFGLTHAGHVVANTMLLLAALDWARTCGANRFVFLSSSGVFGVAKGTEAVDESTPSTATDPYCAAKRAGEILMAGATEPGFETLVLRLGPVFGPHETTRPTRPTPSMVARMIAAAQSTGEITLPSPDARRDWTYLPDIARAMGVLLDHPEALPPLLHLTSGEVMLDRDLAQTIARHFPATRIRTAAPTSAHPPRPAMISRVTSPLHGFDWTPVKTGIGAILAVEATT